MRMFLRLILHRTRLTISDWILLLSAADAIALFATDAVTYKLGGMDEYDPDAPPTPVDTEITRMKVAFAGNYFYDSGIYLPKLALLAFYYKLVPPTNIMPKLRKFLYATTGITISFFLTTILVDTFWCGSNVSVNWDPDGTCSSFDSMNVTRIDWALNIAADLMGTLMSGREAKGIVYSSASFLFLSSSCTLLRLGNRLLYSVLSITRATNQQAISYWFDRDFFFGYYYSSYERRQVRYDAGYPRLD